MKKSLILVFLIILLLPNKIMATSGSLKASTIKECEGNLYGQHGSDNHFHLAIKNENGSYSAKGDAIYTDPCPSNNEIAEKTSDLENKTIDKYDSSLKEILLDGKQIEIKDTMEYKTTKEEIDLKITATDDKSKVEYNTFDKLELGNNIVNIKVTALDNSVTKYVLIIVREKELNNDTSVEVKINGEKIEFNDYKTTLEVKNNVKNLDIDYILSNDNSKIEIIGNENFVIGKNDVKIIVTAENGDIQEYIITVTKLDWFNSIIKIILGSSIVVTIVAFVKKILGK